VASSSSCTCRCSTWRTSSNEASFPTAPSSEILLERRFVDEGQIAAGEAEVQLGERLCARRDHRRAACRGARRSVRSALRGSERFQRDARAFGRLPATQAYALGAIPYRLNGSAIEVAIADPTISPCRTGSSAHRIAREAALREPRSHSGRAQALPRRGGVLKGVSEDFRLVMVKETEEGREETVSLEKLGDVSSPVVRLINTLLLDASPSARATSTSRTTRAASRSSTASTGALPGCGNARPAPSRALSRGSR